MRFFNSHDLGDYIEPMPEVNFDVHLKPMGHLSTLDTQIYETEVNQMSHPPNLAQIEHQIAQLSPQEQLKLMAHIAEQLSRAPLNQLRGDLSDVEPQQERETDELLALCDAAAEMFEDAFDSAEEIRRMRQQRDEHLWPNKS